METWSAQRVYDDEDEAYSESIYPADGQRYFAQLWVPYSNLILDTPCDLSCMMQMGSEVNLHDSSVGKISNSGN